MLYALHPCSVSCSGDRLHRPLSDSKGWARDAFLVFLVQKRYGEALHLHGRALTILENALGADHPDVAVALGYKASCLAELVSECRGVDEPISHRWCGEPV